MEQLVEYLISYGSYGMFVAAFLAGSFFPFSSELVMLGLLGIGAAPDELLIWATAGNTLGGAFNYGIGSLGREEWITRWCKVSPKRLHKSLSGVRRYGAWAGLLAWVPILGSVITVAMGFLRVRFIYAIATVAAGKYVRYWLLIQAYLQAAG